MRLLIALAGGFTAYLIIGLFVGVAPSFERRPRLHREAKLQRWLAQVGSPLTPAQFIAASAGIGIAAEILFPSASLGHSYGHPRGGHALEKASA